MNGLKTDYEGQMVFDAINAATEDGAKALNSYRLRGHPSYVVVDTTGAALWSFSGQTTAAHLQEQIKTYLMHQ